MKRTITIRGRTGRYDVPSFVLAQNETLQLCFAFEETSSGVFRAILTHGNAPKIIVSLATEKSITITPEWILKGNTEPVCVTLQMLDPAQSKVIKNDYYIEPLTMLSVRAVGFRRIRSPRIGSSPNVSAGGPSMMMLIHSRSSAEKGDSNPSQKSPSTVQRKTSRTDATLTVS